jgi:hypothetical protein
MHDTVALPLKYAGAPHEVLKNFVERRHPDYADKIAHWEFLEATYTGGREWFKEHLFKYHKETQAEFDARLDRAYRFNHTREVVDLIQKYISKSPVQRAEDAPEQLKAFWNRATMNGLDIDQFMLAASAEASKLGSVWIFTDTNLVEGEVVSVADAARAEKQAYAYTVSAKDVLDMGYDELGHLIWVLVREWRRDDDDPIFGTGEIKPRYRLWAKTEWFLFEEREQTIDGEKQIVIVQTGQGVNALGEIPGFRLDHLISEALYCSTGLIDDIAYLDRAVANYLSNIDAIIQDQTFSQLVIPSQSISAGDDVKDKVIEMGTKRIFTYDSEGGGKPEYISPDPKQAGVILQIINKIIGEIYHSVGMAGERTKQDNAVGIDNSSGVAKAYDFEQVNSLLVSKASAMENAENKLADLIMKWNGLEGEMDGDEPVKYPETFDVRSLFDEFTIAENLGLVAAPDTVRQEQMRQVVHKLFPRIAKATREKMDREINQWPPRVELNIGTQPTAFGSSTKEPATKEPATKAPAASATTKRQGQVTKKTA